MKSSQIESIVDIVDIDKDGYIDRYDLETFLNRYSNKLNASASMTDINKAVGQIEPLNSISYFDNSKSYFSSSVMTMNNNLFPTNPINNDGLADFN